MLSLEGDLGSEKAHCAALMKEHQDIVERDRQLHKQRVDQLIQDNHQLNDVLIKKSNNQADAHIKQQNLIIRITELES